MNESRELPEPRFTDDRRYHIRVLAIACAVCVLAFLLDERADGRVCVRRFSAIPLPQSCVSRAWLGLNCPGCGLTRSIVHLAERDWRGSWRAHRLGWLLALIILIQIPYRLLAIRRGARGPLIAPRWQAVLGYALIALLFGNWLVELAAGRATAG
jgi:hypothetical protein